MMNPYWMPFLMIPRIPTTNEMPPTVYSLLESIVNFGKDDKTKIKNLASAGRTTFFDFDYPLSEKVDKEKFECMILNHFLKSLLYAYVPRILAGMFVNKVSFVF